MAEANVNVFLKPDPLLASLEAKLRKATEAEAVKIQEQINERQAEITAEFGSVGFGSGGYVIPNYAYSTESGPGYGDLLAKQTAVQSAVAGKMQLTPSATMYNDPVTGQTTNLNSIYQAQYYGPQGQTGYVKDPVTGELMDQYAYAQRETLAGLAGNVDPKTLIRKFYNADGTELTPEQVAKTAQGVGQARAGWDIGFGPGMLAGGVNARELSDDQLRGGIVNNLVASGEMPVAGYNPVTGQVTPNPSATGFSDLPAGVTVVSTYADPTTGDVTAVLSNGTTRVLAASGREAAEKKSAYDLLYSEFNNLGIGGLVPDLKTLIEEGVSPAEFTLRLRASKAYENRFAANKIRINKGLRALSEAEYIGLEDQFQDIMRRYGLPESYYARGDMGRQIGFEQLIANDVSNVELEDRISTAQRRVLNANPEVTQALKQFYPDISNGEILAYTLDPKNAIEQIKRKITAAEIGGAAIQSGLQTGVSRAEQLQAAGITKETAQQGFGTIAGGLQRGSQLASIYGESPYTQATAEQEVFNVPGAQEARKQRQKITGLEKATFGGQSGLTSSALTRDRAGGY
jgi:hypothetical protein